MQFTVTKVPNAGCSNDGKQIIARLENAQGETLDLFVGYQAFEEVINSLNEAQSVAHERRRAGTAPDQSVSLGDAAPRQVKGFRYLVADDRSNMILQIQTAMGRIDIKLEPQVAMAFRDATNRNCELLTSPSHGRTS